MSENGSRAPVVILTLVFVALVCLAAGVLLALTFGADRVPVDVEIRPPIDPVPPEPAPADADALAESERVRRRVVERPTEPEIAAPTGSNDAIALSKEEFLRTYRDAFLDAAGRLPDAQQENAAWARAHVYVEQLALRQGAGDGSIDADIRREVEFSERGDIMLFLTDESRRRDLLALRNDPESLTRLFAHRTTGPQLDGPTRLGNADQLVDDGSKLMFGPGVHSPTWKGIGEAGLRVPRDLTIQGAGIDATLIRLSDFSTWDVVWNLHIKDCTIDCGNDGAFDLRNREASVLVERVRFVRFDAGHGGCDLFSAGGQGGAVYARSCVFAGGYGHSPGHGNILDDSKLARFEDCTFERLRYGVLGRGGGAAAFVRCVFRDCPDDIAMLESEAQSQVPTGIVVTDCTTEWTIPEEHRRDGDAYGRELSSLFAEAK